MNRTLCCFLFSILFTLSTNAQKTSLPNTLLWRISGKGLSKPSYLFGTMHVQDRRVFQFSDSLYHFLESVDGYAMEIDPNAAMTALLKTISEPDTTAFLKDEMSKGDFKKIAAGLEAKFGVPADRITKKQAWLYKQGWDARARIKPDDMDAAVDLYLYNIAKKSGKWVGGIEDLEDQLNIIEEMGSGFDANDLFGSMGTGKSEMEKLIRIYLAQDLNKIEETTETMGAGVRDTVLLRRNHKMARRIDSLMHIRNHFFAIGAAHLPGSEGVLQLMKERGFTIEPVISKKTIAPQNYTYTKKELPWETVESDDKTYTVSMPGKAAMLSPDGVTKMRMYADLGTGLIYFSTSIPIAAGMKKDSVLAAMVRRVSNKNSKPQKIIYSGIAGFEALKDSAGYFYRVRLLPDSSQVVMVMLGSQKRPLLYSEEAERFYRSLTVTPPVVKPPKPIAEWYSYRDDRMAVQVAFPDTPEVNKTMQQTLEHREGAASWHFTNQTYIDIANNNYYMLIVKEAGPGYYILADSALFDEAKNNAESNPDITVTKYETGYWNGLPAMWMNGWYKQNELLFKSLTVNRGNRGYSLMAMYDAATDTTQVMHFLQSLQLPSYNRASFQTYTDPINTFTTSAPAPITIMASQDSTVKTRTAVSYDSLSAFSFQVTTEPHLPYFWTANDSTFYATTITGYIGAGDSMLYERKITNGAATGREYGIRMAGGRNFKRLHFLLNGDSTYMLYTVAPETFALQKEADLFFNDFRFLHYSPAKNLFQNKGKKLIADLETGDSTAFEQAKDYIDAAAFTRSDLPLLHEALLTPYRDSGNYNYGVLHQLLDKAVAISDTQTIAFINEKFETLTGEKERLKYPFLKTLAGIKKDTAYGVLKKLLLQHTPVSGNSNAIAYKLRDSLLLTKTLFPEIFSLLSDSLFYDELVNITTVLLDSNVLKISDVALYQKTFMAQARKKWLAGRDSSDKVWDFYHDIALLGKLNTAESNGLLQQMAQSKFVVLKQQAVSQLLTNNQPVSTSNLQKIAADTYHRAKLYAQLKKENKLALFPAAYRNQKSLAESLVYQNASDDEEPSKMVYIGQREATFNGKKGLYYLFKVDYGYDDGAYLGIAGPYKTGDKLSADYPDVLGLSGDVFDAKQIDKQLRDYLKAQEKEEE